MPHHLRTNSLAILGVLMLLTAAVNAQEGEDHPPATVRIYHCNMPVRELARTLQELAGESDVRIVSEQINNLLIVRATEAELERFDSLVRELNRPAPRVALSLTVLEVDGSLDVQDPDELLRMVEAGQGARIREIRLTSLENQVASVQLGERRPVVNGASFARGGERFNTYQQEQFGTMLTMTARVDEGGRVVAELSFEMSRLDESIAAAESAAEGTPPALRTATLQTTVSIPDGESVLLTDFDSQDSPDGKRLIGIVTATVDQSGAAARVASENRLTLEARRMFGVLDRDSDGVISSEEWERSVRIRGMFERNGLDLSEPMTSETFMENYVRLSNARE